jgi:hypothetical protein
MVAADENGVGAKQVKRAEWASAVAFLFSAATAVFTGGVLYGQVQAQGSRITVLESHDSLTTAQMSDLKVSLAEIKTNVQFLADRAREDRAARLGIPQQ